MAARLALILATLVLLAAGCGGGDEKRDPVEEAIITWTFEGKCEVMTDKFLEEQAFTGDTRGERCDTFEKSFQKPQYSKDDLKFRSTKVTGDRAEVVVGSDIANIESTYHMVKGPDGWQIDEVD